MREINTSIHSGSFFWDGWSGGVMVLGKLPVLRCGWGLFGHLYSYLSFLSSFSLSLGDSLI